LVVEPKGVSDATTGFELSGPFSLAGGRLPVMRLTYTQIAGARRATATLVSDGRGAWVLTRGRTYRLSSAQAASLTGLSGRQGGLKALGIDFDRWIRDPDVRDGPKVDGATTQSVTGEVDVARALADLLAAGRRAGAKIGFSDAARKSLAGSVKRSHAQVMVGRDDHIPRRLALELEFAFSEQARQLLSGLRGASVRLSFRIARPNARVHVARPAGAASAPPLPS
jgi:hypothetical protein